MGILALYKLFTTRTDREDMSGVYTELPVWRLNGTFPLRTERFMNVNLSGSDVWGCLSFMFVGTQISVLCESSCVNFCYIIQIRCDPDVKWPESLPWRDGVTHEPFSSSTHFLNLNAPDSVAHFLAPSAWKELNLVQAARTRQRAGFVSDRENGTLETRPHQSRSSELTDPPLLSLHRELWLHGPDCSSEVGPEEHPRVWRRSWESHHIWTEFRYENSLKMA